MTSAGTALWEQVRRGAEQGGPSTEEQVAARWAALSPEEQVAATRAGTALWRKVANR